MDYEKELKKPFNQNEVEWRVNRVVKTKAGNKAVVLAYVTARAVMDRLDDVFGVDGWQDSYQMIGSSVICSLAVKINSEWIVKMDGAPQTQIESVKGGISDSLKRAAVKFGIGRYLYNLTETWVDITEKKISNDAHYIKDRKTEVSGYWQTPQLPAWALPENTKAKKRHYYNFSSEPATFDWLMNNVVEKHNGKAEGDDVYSFDKRVTVCNEDGIDELETFYMGTDDTIPFFYWHK